MSHNASALTKFFALALILIILFPSGAYKPTNVSVSDTAVTGSVSSSSKDSLHYCEQNALKIMLKYAEFDPLIELPEIPQELLSGGDQNYYIVQFKGPVQASWKTKLEAIGCIFHGYIPEYAFIVQMDMRTYQKVKCLPEVRWVGTYEPAYKISPYLYENYLYGHHVEAINLLLNVQLFLPDPDAIRDTFTLRQMMKMMKHQRQLHGLDDELHTTATILDDLMRNKMQNIDLEAILRTEIYKQVLSQLKQLDAKIISIERELIQLELHDYTKLPRLACIPEVKWIEPYVDPHVDMNVIRAYTGANTVANTFGYDGSNVVVAVADTGCDWTHPEFGDSNPNDNAGKILRYLYDSTPEDSSGHGTCTAGIIGSTGNVNADAKGIAPGSALVIQETIDNPYSPGLATIFEDAANCGAKIHSNSWGTSSSQYPTYGEYGTAAEVIDDATRDASSSTGYQPLLVVIGAGNEGPSADTIDTVGTAKNAITVGAIYDSDSTNLNYHGMEDFSGRGPCDDGRYKPDLVACGSGIYTIDIAGTGGYSTGDYTSFGGTSGATPIVAGATTIVSEAYENNYFENNPSGLEPSPALLKALLINGANCLPGLGFPSNAQGWGEVSVGNIITADRNYWMKDQVDSVTTGTTKTYQVYSPGGSVPLKITLVWTDYPGTTSASQHLVNDLNLKVSKGSAVWKGNVFGTNSAWSVQGGSYDTKNNVECVYIQNPEGGIYDIEIIGYNVPYGPQDFAIVASGIATGEGLLFLDRSYYNATTTALISYSDTSDDVNNPYAIDYFTVEVVSDTDPSGISVQLTESQINSAYFTGTLYFSETSSGTNTIHVTSGESITVRAHDTSPVDQWLEITVYYDSIYPVISNVRIIDMGRQFVTVYWETSEPTDTRIDIGTVPVASALNPKWYAPDNETYTMEHYIWIPRLTPNTQYYFMVCAQDHARNLAIDNNGGSYYKFKTQQPQVDASGNSFSILVVNDDQGIGTCQFVELCIQAVDLTYSYVNRNLPQSPSLTAYDIVIWDCGPHFTGTLNDTTSPDNIDDQTLISNYLSNGGKLLISGSSIAYDAYTLEDPELVPDDIGGSTSQFYSWYQNTLHANYVADDVTAGTDQAGWYADGAPGDPIADPENDNEYALIYPAVYADEITPASGATNVYNWRDKSTQATVKYSSGSSGQKLVTLAFMWYSMYGTTKTNAPGVLFRIIDWFIPQPSPTSISGTVTDLYGNPVANAVVYAYAPSAPDIVLGADVTNTVGTYKIDGLQAGFSYDVRATKLGYEPGIYAGVTPTSGTDTPNIDIILESAAISGTVTDILGNPLENVKVWALANDGTQLDLRRETFTNADGIYYLTGLTTGTYDIKAIAHGYLSDTIPTISFTYGIDITGIDFQLVKAQPHVLLVADDWGAGFDKVFYAPALDANDILYDLWEVDTAGSPSSDNLANYDLVIWVNGYAYYKSPTENALSSSEQTTIQSYLDSGGSLWLIGMDTLYGDLMDPATNSFVQNYLHVSARDNDVGTPNPIEGVDGDPITDGASYPTDNPYELADYGDRIVPTSDANGIFYQDSGHTSYNALRYYAGTYKLVFFAFELGMIGSFADRADCAQRVVNWFNPQESLADYPPLLSGGQVTPLEGDEDTLFKYNVTYTDPENMAPVSITITIDGSTPVPMTQEPGEGPLHDGDFSNGESFIYEILGAALGIGDTHTFRYSAHDLLNDAYGDIFDHVGPSVYEANHPPTLTEGTVEPPEGDTATEFTYTVIYHDPDNDPPLNGAPKVHIDDTAGILMELDTTSATTLHDGDYTNGEQYRYITTISTPGTHHFFFSCSDGELINFTTDIGGPVVATLGNHIPELQEPELTPTSGTVTTIFTYRILYQDADNDPPTDDGYINVVIDGEPYLMQEVNPLDTNYVDGKLYEYQTIIPTTGGHTYYFEASDGKDTYATLPKFGPLVSTEGNYAPYLTGGAVEPTTGTPADTYTFTITYTDYDNQAPKFIKIVIDDSIEHDLVPEDVLDTVYSDGKKYIYTSAEMTTGVHSFYFYCSDGIDTDLSELYTGPVVGTPGNNVSRLTFAEVTPSFGNESTLFTYSVIYTDLDNEAPEYIRVVIDNTPPGEPMLVDMSSDLSLHDNDFRNGEKYVYQTKLSIGEHIYYFEASDGIDPVRTRVFSKPIVKSVPRLLYANVTPPDGEVGWTFNYSVTYIDDDGDLPVEISIIINELEPIPMLEVEPADTDTRDGKIYYYEIALTESSRTNRYKFSATDGVYYAVEGTNWHYGPNVTYPPLLSSGKVTPLKGTVNDTYTYSVRYADQDDDAPHKIQVVIDDGTPQDMVEKEPADNNYVDGKWYIYTTKLSIGNHTFRFIANDGIADATGDTNTHQGPIVTEFQPTDGVPSIDDEDEYPPEGDEKVTGKEPSTYDEEEYAEEPTEDVLASLGYIGGIPILILLIIITIIIVVLILILAIVIRRRRRRYYRQKALISVQKPITPPYPRPPSPPFPPRPQQQQPHPPPRISPQREPTVITAPTKPLWEDDTYSDEEVEFEFEAEEDPTVPRAEDLYKFKEEEEEEKAEEEEAVEWE